MNEMWLGIGPTHRTLNMNLLIIVVKPLKSLEDLPTCSLISETRLIWLWEWRIGEHLGFFFYIVAVSEI